MASTLTDLNNFDLIAVTGEDAAIFLQGQLTCNVEKVTTENSVCGAYCDINGRIISDLRLIAMNGALYLLCSRGMGFALKKILDKYIVFSKAKTVLATSQFERYGVYGSGAQETVKSLFGAVPQEQGHVVPIEGGVVFRLAGAEPRYEILVSVDQDELLERLQEIGVTDDLEEWELADIRQGIVHINPEIQDTYTPQLLNYDLTGLIDFKKGCYTGQEIVARMHYRGTAKKRLYRAAVQDVRVSLESQITHKGEVAGEIISVAMTDSGSHELLAILPCELIAQKVTLELRNDHSDIGEGKAVKSSLKILPLPGLSMQQPENETGGS
ncbi:MAG: hypothetical protein A3H44_01680 [Gammaproteobacteria bacterium RIFCSPLOWO2_02_FULL_57_10]|nr:MAG: hypothetical protein A3H44_01680 [Gammaproteobacteria bacterium RIFCSPLOWO2_02_FULL_57_10]